MVVVAHHTLKQLSAATISTTQTGPRCAVRSGGAHAAVAPRYNTGGGRGGFNPAAGRGGGNTYGGRGFRGDNRGPPPLCSHCRVGHDKERCFLLDEATRLRGESPRSDLPSGTQI